jgi:hypothetical protein
MGLGTILVGFLCLAFSMMYAYLVGVLARNYQYLKMRVETNQILMTSTNTCK